MGRRCAAAGVHGFGGEDAAGSHPAQSHRSLRQPLGPQGCRLGGLTLALGIWSAEQHLQRRQRWPEDAKVPESLACYFLSKDKQGMDGATLYCIHME